MKSTQLRKQILSQYKAAHATSVRNRQRTNAAIKIQKFKRNYTRKSKPITQAVRDIKREIVKEKTRLQQDASYRKKVFGKIGSSVGQSTVSGIGQTVGKLGAGALMGYILAKSREKDETK
jgi:ABC-type glycerol-3-phosphate transport system permease component